MTTLKTMFTTALAAALMLATAGSIQGPSTGSTPYVLPLLAGMDTISVFTVDNTGANPDDAVGGYQMGGVPDGMGAYDNGDGTFTLLLNHEIPSSLGVARAHGGVGAYVSEWVISKNTLGVLAGRDLIKTVYGWNVTAQASNITALVNPVFLRFCSADLPARTAFFNAASGLGSTERIFMDGEEDSTHGWALAHVATGPSKGNSYILGKFNQTTNGSGRTGIGNWETLVANPFPQDKTLVIGNSDGGTGLQTNALSVYFGTKQSSGSEADKAGLTNGTLKMVVVAGNAVEIVNTTTRATNITSGTRFSLSDSASTTFSRPEDGAWNPNNPQEYYFVTTDQLDQVSDGLGAQIGQTRLWRLTFDDLSNPDAGGKIDLLIDGRTVNGQKANMFDNITVNRQNGRLLLQEDVGGAAHNGKMWEYDPATDGLTMITMHDPARFGDRAGGVTTPATFPFNNDEETSGVIDITDLMAGSTLNTGNPGEAWYISSDQAHYTPSGGTGITLAQVEGGQMFVIHEQGIQTSRSGFVRDRRTGLYSQLLTVLNGTGAALAGPVSVVLDSLTPGVTLTNASGTVGASPYILLPGADKGLAPGAAVSVTLQFSNPSNGAITYASRLPALPILQFLSPHLIAEAGPTTVTLGATTFVNKGLVGVGRLSASQLDPFGDSLGSASGLQITNWVKNGNGTYGGTVNILPDRGYNSGTFYADFAARVNRIAFTFTPYTGAANLGGVTDADKLATQNQIAFSGPVTGTRFTYDDPNTLTTSVTTGLDPAGFNIGLFGNLLPYVPSFQGPPSPGAASQSYTGINKLTLDSEALAFRPDGSGYVGDEYGANVYLFNSALKIVGAIVPPAALQPHLPASVLNFTSAANPADGRRNNQGFEGVSLSPDGTRLFVLLQSAAVQDGTAAANDQNAKHTRLLIYDVSTNPTPSAPLSEYVLTLPTYTLNGQGGNVNRTCAQSEIIALDNFRFLVLSRDGNGLGNSALNPSMFKSVLLVDTRLGNPTDIANSSANNMSAGKITTAPGVLDAAITPLQSVEALNMLNTTQLGKFNIQVDTGTGQVSKLTLGEKWEGMALTYAQDPANPNDYFLFIANDNDFLSSGGTMRGPGGTIAYNGFNGYPASRIPAAVGSPNNENDTVMLVFRVTITPAPTAPVVPPAPLAAPAGSNSSPDLPRAKRVGG